MNAWKMQRTILPVAVFIILFCFLSPVYPQEASNKGRIGLSTAIQESQLDIMIPIWISDNAVLAPGINAVWIEDGGQDIGFGFNLRSYRDSRKKITPYFGGRFGAMLLMPDGGKTVTDYLFGVMLGGEFFLVKQFSFGIEAQINATMSDEESSRFGNPGGLNINTGSAFIANIYF
jgi:hypothetical protein